MIVLIFKTSFIYTERIFCNFLFFQFNCFEIARILGYIFACFDIIASTLVTPSIVIVLRYHILPISISRSVYLLNFSNALGGVFLSAGSVTSTNRHIFSTWFLKIISGRLASILLFAHWCSKRLRHLPFWQLAVVYATTTSFREGSQMLGISPSVCTRLAYRAVINSLFQSATPRNYVVNWLGMSSIHTA